MATSNPASSSTRRKPRRATLVEVKALVSHVMETGQRKDSAGNAIPRKILNKFTCTVNGKQVFAADFEPAISANPYIQFKFKAQESGPVVLTWIDDDGTQDRRRRDDHGQLNRVIPDARSATRNIAATRAPWISGSRLRVPNAAEHFAKRRLDDLAGAISAGCRCDRRDPPGGWTRGLRAAAVDASRPSALRAARQRHAGPPHRHPCASSCRCCSASRRPISASAKRSGRCRTSPAARFSISTGSRRHALRPMR